jgi:hypothetical protein
MNAPRRWFQIHLSTALFLMILAGFLMWKNQQPYVHNLIWGEQRIAYGYPMPWQFQPIIFYESDKGIENIKFQERLAQAESQNEKIELTHVKGLGWYFTSELHPAEIDARALFKNVLLNILVLCLIGSCMEAVIRERRKSANPTRTSIEGT